MFAENGFLVILPDYFRGDVFPESLRDQGEFMCKHTKWENLRVHLEEIVIPFARLNGAAKFGTVGTCWGGYNMIRLSGNFAKNKRSFQNYFISKGIQTVNLVSAFMQVIFQ